MSFHLICDHENASNSINGIAYAPNAKGHMQTVEPVTKEVAAVYIDMPNFTVVKAGPGEVAKPIVVAAPVVEVKTPDVPVSGTVSPVAVPRGPGRPSNAQKAANAAALEAALSAPETATEPMPEPPVAEVVVEPETVVEPDDDDNPF